MTRIEDMITELCAAEGIDLPEGAAAKLWTYAEMLVEKNKVMNLTAITEPEEIAVKHFLDSILPLKQVEIPVGASVIDIGTGAGFPGVVLKIVRPDIKLTLLDSLNKRLVFLKEVCGALKFSDVTLLHARAEEAGRGEHREKYDFAFARAVAQLNVLCEYCLPYVKVGGCFVAMKGKRAAEELEGAKKAITMLSGKLEGYVGYSLPGGDERGNILIKKISQMSPKYPRQSAKISKNPL